MINLYDSLKLDGLSNVKANETKVQSKTLSFALSWWMKICFCIGLPLNGKNGSVGTNVFIVTILLADITLGLIDVINAYQIFQHSKAYTTWYRVSYAISHYNSFVSFAILHGVLVWNLRSLSAVVQEVNREIHIDSKLLKMLRMCVLLLIPYTSATQFCTYVVAYRANTTVFDWSGVVRRVYWMMLSTFALFPIIISYTIALLIFPLGYQFALLREAIEKESFFSLRKIYTRYITLCKLAEKLQKCLDMPLLVLFGSTLVSLCLTAFFVADQLAYQNYYVLGWMIFFVVERAIRCVCVCSAAEYLKDQVDSVALQVAEVEIKHRHLPHTRDIVRRFAASICNLEHMTTLSVGGFFQLNKSSLLGMLAAVVSYVVILCQFRGTERYETTSAPTAFCSNASVVVS